MRKLSPLLLLAGLLSLQATSTASTTPALLEARWLASNLQQDGVVILDIQEETLFQRHHLPGAVNIPFSRWRSDGKAEPPSSLRDIGDYEQMLSQLGIGNDDHIVITTTGLQPADLSAPARVFWTLRLLGHEHLSVIDGGLAAYARQRLGPIAQGRGSPRDPANYKARVDMTLLATAEDVQSTQLRIDARSPEEYLGLRSGGADERPGTIPGAINLPYSWLTKQAGSGSLLDATRVEALFRKAGVPDRDGAVHFCHTGHRASLTWFVDYAVLGNSKARLYDASMLEWARDDEREIELKWIL